MPTGEIIIGTILALIAGYAFILITASLGGTKLIVEGERAWGDVPRLPDGLRRMARVPGEGGKATRSQEFARHIAHDTAGTSR